MMNLMLGDCLERMKEIPDGSVDMVLTDPPYGTTACKWDAVIPFDPMWDHLNRITKQHSAIVLTGSQPFTSKLIISNLCNFKYCWVWEKTQAVGHLNAWKMPMRAHEDICIFSNGVCNYYPIIVDKPQENIRPVSSRTKKTDCYGDHRLDTHRCPPNKSMPKSIIRFANQQRQIHPTQKPVPLLEYFIRTYTLENATVLDFTMGSGSTGIACLNTGRNFIGIEKDEKYFNIARERINRHEEVVGL